MTWFAPERNADTIVQYEVQIAVPALRSKESFFALETRLHLPAAVLPDDGEWSVRIRALTADGRGEYSQALVFSSGEEDDEDSEDYAENDDEEDDYQLGAYLIDEGRISEGLACYARAARRGLPWALSSYLWLQLKRAEFFDALQLAEECIPACHEYLNQYLEHADESSRQFCRLEIANAESNAALCKLAIDGDMALTDDALQTWRWGAELGHLESQFYPAILALKDGDVSGAQQIVSALTTEEQTMLEETMSEGITESVGWFADWCRTGASLLSQGARSPGRAAPTGESAATEPRGASPSRFCGQCGASREPGTNFCTACGSRFPD